ncbi:MULTISPECIES: hypothetical protein [unclassified Breznakia]|uniref:hypothetical protein n=1 Tax=unclassified Breznakia TaxID=2623764 RepID=UPI0024736D00|nr:MULTISPECIES: hypothetical protein [unclassified Breznakia]MDH6367610.1 hypothetical protein [Breznakia sp. PH1-1]MDH6405303.1 hypothetical protein [Breznakia sp. PF1-11]MDH6412440.1 hypothetical protein [Breznakia sp. PFB1-11]MDH6415382.1 hypothetical protein [Breznakia sp. PFB1-14]MDH6417111.1 hypothetical protein [Breznakia sp. PFB1-4]
MKIIMTKKFSKKQIDAINTNLLQLPKKITGTEKMKRVIFDMTVFLMLIIYAYLKYEFSIAFISLVVLTIIMIGFLLYYHTNERKNYILELFFLRIKGNINTKSKYEIKVDEDRILILKSGKKYEGIYGLLSWNELIVCAVENDKKEKKLAFLNLDSNDKTEFINKVKDIYNLSLEHVDNNERLSNYLK